jgi:UDP-glucose 4-epimerase
LANVLVTGGAGYIGQHVCKALLKEGHRPFVADNYSNTPRHQTFIAYGFSLGNVNISSSKAVDTLGDHIRQNRINAVIHLAGLIDAAESDKRPALYYRDNVFGTMNVLEAMDATNLKALVFASSASVYDPIAEENFPDRLDEESFLSPQSVYGQTKFVCEQMIKDHQLAHGKLWPISLRLFNVGGASSDLEIGESHASETHLIPRVIQAALGPKPNTDYVYASFTPKVTPDYRVKLNVGDGTQLTYRDYVHVEDVARAFVLAMEASLERKNVFHAYNVCSESRVSPLDILNQVQALSGKNDFHTFGPRRSDDRGDVVGWAKLIQGDLGWKAEHDIQSIVSSAWAFHSDQHKQPEQPW